MPEVRAGDDLGALIATALRTAGMTLDTGDVVVVTSKVVSKSLGRYADPADRPALVLQESTGVVSERATSGSPTRVVVSAAGPVMAGAGIDASNAQDDRILLLPHEPDRVADDIRLSLRQAVGDPAPDIAVLLSDTSGRPWRAGVTDFALGLSHLMPFDDLRGLPDTQGRDLAVTLRNLADEIAAAADLVKGKLDRVPVAVVRGLAALVGPGGEGAASLVRTGPGDWFGMGRAEAVRAALGIAPGSAESEAAGIESVHPEPLRERVARAVRVARAAGDRVDAKFGPASEGSLAIRLRADDPMTLGRVWARLEVALAGERLVSRSDREGDAVLLTVSAQAAPPG
nr:coenzyme F420-0:L-glutamate ligase [Flexivirga meconopsidis]